MIRRTIESAESGSCVREGGRWADGLVCACGRGAIFRARPRSLACRSLYFFFQAEDGIRDFHVTGVQTCALPISRTPSVRSSSASTRLHETTPAFVAAYAAAPAIGRLAAKIGRASCRERV